MQSLTKIISVILIYIFSANIHAVVIDFDTPTTNVTYNVDATQINNYGRLTPAANGQVGSLWYNTAFDTSSDFTVSFDLFAGSNPGGADGLTFAVIDTSIGLNAIGGAGGALGYLGLAGPSVAWEFDTWNNGAEVSGNHIGIDINGIEGSTQDLTPLGITLEDGLIHNIIVDYTNATSLFRVSIDGQGFQTNLALPQTAYFGFTGATGGANNLQYIDNWDIDAKAVPEPATLALLGFGMIGFFCNRKKAA